MRPHRSGWKGLCTVALALASVVASAVADPSAPEPVELAAGVYTVPGASGAADRSNPGRTGNASFIVGRTGVLAIDSGGSAQQGQALLAAIHRVTDQPVRLLILTNPRREFAFGASAFRAQGIPVAMHEKAAATLAARFGHDLDALRGSVGDDAVRGTIAVRPDIVFEDPQALDAAVLIGRPIQLLHFGVTSGPGDIVVYDPRTRTLFGGALVEGRQPPDRADGNVPQWLDALNTLEAYPIETIVPGHGAAGDKRLILLTERDLSGPTRH